jgi:dipeptidyl aminopeptidase/acylaminoacyl peptidase
MEDPTTFEDRLAIGLERLAGPRRPVDTMAITQVASTSAWTSKTRSMVNVTRFAIAAAVVALFGGFVLVAQPTDRMVVTVPGAQTEGLPPITGPAGNGLIAFAHDGDIYVGDPVTGESEAIVSGAEYDMGASFSPDGSRIAFTRYEEDPRNLPGAWPSGSLIVVRPDGSDERVVEPAYGGFLWAPDGRWLISLIRYEAPDRTLTMLDATGVAPPRTVTLPTLDLSCCGFRYSHVATFMRPPLGDRILTWAEDYGPWYLDVVDADGSNATRLIDEQWFTDNGFEYVGQPKWSPDGSQIAFDTWADEQSRIIMMNADGSDARVIGGGPSADPDWSPDGARIKSHRRPECDAARDCSVLTIIDVVTGAEHELVVTDSHIGWSSWSPDGMSILYTSGEQGRLSMIDVETGEVNELPWETDSWPGPSWQRVAAD